MFLMKLSRIVAMLGSIITLVQITLLATEKNGICLNSGCQVVESLTTVPPIFFSIAGFFFFQTIFWGIWFAAKDEKRLQYVNILLLAGLAAEGVLVSFQHFVAQTFCTYCLIIFSLVVLLNALTGLRHFVGGIVIFASVLIGFASLQFTGVGIAPFENLDSGTFAILDGREKEKKYLFFSSTCKYCEEIIASLSSDGECTIRFNPIDQINEFALEAAVRQENYKTTVNSKLMQSLGLNQVPVLLTVTPAGFQVIKGSRSIQQYFAVNCSKKGDLSPAREQMLLDDGLGMQDLPENSSQNLTDGSCTVNTDCEESLPLSDVDKLY